VFGFKRCIVFISRSCIAFYNTQKPKSNHCPELSHSVSLYGLTTDAQKQTLGHSFARQGKESERTATRHYPSDKVFHTTFLSPRFFLTQLREGGFTHKIDQRSREI